MILNDQIRQAAHDSVLCWLATVDTTGQPNVSPKEAFVPFGESLLIANIASPQTVKNISTQPLVALSFVDVFVQKGYQLKGRARVVKETDHDFASLAAPLQELTAGRFPFSSLIELSVQEVKTITAPSYYLYPDTTEQQQISSALQTYRVSHYQERSS